MELDLFNTEINNPKNLLPRDGAVFYYGKIFDTAQADHYLENLLLNIDWKNDQSFMYGKLITTRRKVAWYGNKNFNYTYSNIKREALPFTEELLKIKELTEQKTGEVFNSCLLNLYHNGNEGMGWHSDDEKELKKNGAIASLSFGAERKFLLKHKQDKQTVNVLLEHGSLLLMKDITQTHWLHRLPVSTKITKPRVNLTFRYILQ